MWGRGPALYKQNYKKKSILDLSSIEKINDSTYVSSSATYCRDCGDPFMTHVLYTALKKISVMHVIKLGFAPVSFPPG